MRAPPSGRLRRMGRGSADAVATAGASAPVHRAGQRRPTASNSCEGFRSAYPSRWSAANAAFLTQRLAILREIPRREFRPRERLQRFFVAIDALRKAPAMRRFPHITSEYRREMRLRLEPDAERDVHKALSRVLQKRLRAAYAPPHQIFMRAHSNGGAKLGREMHPRQPGGFGEICEPYRLLDMFAYVLDHAREPPLWKRSRSSLPLACPPYRSTAAEPCKDCDAYGVRIQPRDIGRNSVRA